MTGPRHRYPRRHIRSGSAGRCASLPARALRVNRLRRRVGQLADRGGRARYAHRSPALRSGSLPTARTEVPACGGRNICCQPAPPLDPSAGCQMLGAASHPTDSTISMSGNDNYRDAGTHNAASTSAWCPLPKSPSSALTCPALRLSATAHLPACSGQHTRRAAASMALRTAPILPDAPRARP